MGPRIDLAGFGTALHGLFHQFATAKVCMGVLGARMIALGGLRGDHVVKLYEAVAAGVDLGVATKASSTSTAQSRLRTN